MTIMRGKRLLAVLLSMVLILAFVGCGSNSSNSGNSNPPSSNSNSNADSTNTGDDASANTAGEPKHIMFVSIVTGGVAWGSAQKGFEDALKELGWTGQYVSPTKANDTAGVIDLLDTAVTNKADGIITVILNPEQATDVLTKARKANIPVVTCNTYTNEELQDCWIGTDPTNMGITQAETVLNLLKSEKYSSFDHVTACYIQTTLQTETQNEQFRAFSERIKKEYPNAKLIQEECNSDAAIAADKLAALLKSYPDLNVVVCQDGYGCPGIANYIESENLQDKLIKIGIDDSPEILDYVSRGVLDCTIAQDFYKMGYQSVYFIKDIKEGKKPPFNNDSGTIVITPDKVQEHLELLKSRGLY